MDTVVAFDCVTEIKWWLALGDEPESGLLRSAAYCAHEEGITRKEWVAAAVECGIHKGTAGNRWREATKD